MREIRGNPISGVCISSEVKGNNVESSWVGFRVWVSCVRCYPKLDFQPMSSSIGIRAAVSSSSVCGFSCVSP